MTKPIGWINLSPFNDDCDGARQKQRGPGSREERVWLLDVDKVVCPSFRIDKDMDPDRKTGGGGQGNRI